ncbi:MAG: PEGA domain-containing protein [Polyangiaceae bacterium]
MSSSASAEETKSNAATAKELYDQGVDLTEKGQFEEAEARFRKAWELQKGFDIAANLGVVEMQLEKPAEAAFYLSFAVANYPASGKQDKREWLEARLAEVRAKVTALRVEVSVPGAEVRVNGKPVGKAPIGEELFVAEGDCSVEVTAPEHEPWALTFKAAAGAARKVQVDLVKPRPTVLPGAVGAGVGLAGLAAGVALYLVSTSKYDEASALHDEIVHDTGNPRGCVAGNANPKCEALKSAAETSDALFAPGVALMVAGAALTAAGGAYLGVVLRPTGSPAAAGKGPRVTRVGISGTGVLLQGSF